MNHSKMLKGVYRLFSDNVYLFIGVIIGLYVSSLFSESGYSRCSRRALGDHGIGKEQAYNLSVYKVTPLPKKQPNTSAKKTKLIRPRYYSTELGIKEKLFVGIFTSEERINTQAFHINRTIGHLVDRIKFFITAQYKLKANFNLTGLVGFTDTRSKYRPFQVMKYIGDTFGQDYDYYFFANDYTFIDAHRLMDTVKGISVSMDVYLGTRVEDSSYCNLDAGIIISNSVLKAVRNNLDWCIMNVISDDHSENLGRCIYHSLGLTCQETVQMERLPSFKLKHFDLESHLAELSNRNDFNTAITVYPILQKNDFYMLNAYFLRERLRMLKENMDKLSESLTETWPPGSRPGAKPATRFDLPKQYYFNMSHVFFPDDFTIIRKHNEPELMDIENIITEVKAYAGNKHSELLFRRLVNGYKKFDLSRGMDYVLDLGFRDLNTGKEMVKRFEVSKPLGKVEFVPVPYVTENTRVTIILPIQESEKELALDFLKNYSLLVMDRKEKAFLMIVLLYQYNSDSKGASDVFADIKDFATKSSTKYKNDDTKVGWLSIKLPESQEPIYLEDYESLNFAIVDLALKKVGLESLSLVLDVYSNITIDFLNRVRMNTILNFQIFSPIPFRQYNPEIIHVKTLEVHKNVGHFDREDYKYISFYGKDYVFARKKYQHIIPLIRVDNDIPRIMDEDRRNAGNIFEMFVKFHRDLHCMRASEMSLRVIYHLERKQNRRKLFLGNENQLARLVLSKAEQIPELL